MFNANLWCYVWDLEDEGIDHVVDRLHGEVGATGVSVATSYHSVEHWRVHAGVTPRIYRADGAVYFQPDAKRYAATRLRPIVAPAIKSRNPLARIADACARRHMHLRSWTVGAHNSALVARHKEMAVRNVFDDMNPTWLCPANPDVREYFRALIGDLSANYPLDAIELESFLFPAATHAHRHEKIGIEFGPADQFLLTLCFCPSCRQAASAADVDVDAAARSTKVRLEATFKAGRGSELSPDELLAEDEPIRQLDRWRTDSMTALIAALAKAGTVPLVLYDFGALSTMGGDLAALAPHADRYLGLCYTTEIDAINRTVKRLRAVKADPAAVERGFHTFAPVCPDAPTLVRQLTRAAELGVRSVNLYNYGIMPETNLDWVRQAIRAAARIAS